MENNHVRDVMIGLDRVPRVGRDETLSDAIRALDAAQENRPGDCLPYRAVLVLDDAGNVVGKLGHMTILSAIEPGYESPAYLAAMDRAAVDRGLVESVSDTMRLLEPAFSDCCRRAAYIRVGDVMRPIEEQVDEDMPLMAAVSTMVRLQTLSILVRSGDQVVGLLRLADLFDVLADSIRDAGSDGAQDADRGRHE